MKKLSFLLILVILIGCKETAVAVKKNEPEELLIEEQVEVSIPSVDRSVLDEIIQECNKVTNVIEIEALHERMIANLMTAIDTSSDIELQEVIIKEVVLFHLNNWRQEIIEEHLLSSSVTVHEDDYEFIESRVSISDAYQIMVAYEKIYLRKKK